MGRKIPAKKHRGVKDPLEQNARRFQMLKSKINAPPKDPDEQPIPRSLIDLFSFRDKDKKKLDIKKKKSQANKDKINEKISKGKKNPISQLQKLPGESGRDFSLRINGAIRALHESTEPQDYPKDFEENDVKGQRMAEQRERRERKRKRAGWRSNNADEPPPLSRAQRFALKKKEKKMKAMNAASGGDEPVYERVPFGESCPAPPALPATKHGAPRPGRRELLLNKLLKGGEEKQKRPQKPQLAPAERMRLERARLDAIAAYRAIKLNPNK